MSRIEFRCRRLAFETLEEREFLSVNLPYLTPAVPLQEDANFNTTFIENTPTQYGSYDENDLNIVLENELEGCTSWTQIDGIYRVTRIEILNKDVSESLNLSGLSALTEFICNNNNLEILNVDGCSVLETIKCTNNQITDISARGCSSLASVEIDDNPLRTLDFTDCPSLSSLKVQCEGETLARINVTDCIGLESLECRNNPLQTLNITGCVSLKLLDVGSDRPYHDFNMTGLSDCQLLNYLDCSNLRFDVKPFVLNVLDITNFANLETLICDNCNLDGLLTTGCESLKYVSCSDNQLTQLNVIDSFQLTHLDCSNNSLGSLSLENLKELRLLNCRENLIKALNIEETPLLETLDCGFNKIKTLSVQHCRELASLKCDNNQLEELVFSGNASLSHSEASEGAPLTEIYCQYNNLQSLDLEGLPNLKILNCGFNQIDTLKIAELSELTDLNCCYNRLSTLDISGVLQLTTLICNANQLTTIYCDIMDMFPMMDLLYCADNQFQSLDFFRFPSLTLLSCGLNPFETLDISQNENLSALYCSEANLTSLDVSHLKNLVEFYCNDNFLSTLDVSSLDSLSDFSCENNNLSTLDISSQNSLTQLNCSGNQLTSLVLPRQVSLEYLRCYDNFLRFSTLPSTERVHDANTGRYAYTPQRLIPLGKDGQVDERIDLSSEYLVQGIETSYRWYYDTGEPLSEAEVQDLGGGSFVVTPLLKDSAFYCEMRNEAFPLLTLQSERVTINPPLPPSEPDELICYEKIGHSLYFSWTASERATEYVFQYKKSTDSLWTTATLQSETTAKVSGLTDDTIYHFRVKAANPSGESDWTTLDVTTQKKTPASPTITAANSRVQRGCSLMLSGDHVTESEALALKWLWDFDNDGIFGETGTAALAGQETGQTAWFDTAYYLPETGGKRTVKLIIEDAEGNRSEPEEYQIMVDSPAPTFTVTFFDKFSEQLSEQLTVKRMSYWEISAVSASNLAIMDWKISWGDGSQDTHIPGGPRSWVNLTHLFDDPGDYQMNITTTNILGEKHTVSWVANVQEPITSQTDTSYAIPDENNLFASMKNDTDILEVEPPSNRDTDGIMYDEPMIPVSSFVPRTFCGITIPTDAVVLEAYLRRENIYSETLPDRSDDWKEENRLNHKNIFSTIIEFQK